MTCSKTESLSPLTEEYLESAKEYLLRAIEEKPENWLNSKKRYVLWTLLHAVNGSLDEDLSGIITDRFECLIYSDSVESLRFFWNSKFVKNRYSTFLSHFIYDLKEKKVVELLSCCI